MGTSMVTSVTRWRLRAKRQVSLPTDPTVALTALLTAGSRERNMDLKASHTQNCIIPDCIQELSSLMGEHSLVTASAEELGRFTSCTTVRCL